MPRKFLSTWCASCAGSLAQHEYKPGQMCEQNGQPYTLSRKHTLQLNRGTCASLHTMQGSTALCLHCSAIDPAVAREANGASDAGSSPVHSVPKSLSMPPGSRYISIPL
jgi:hypothetical protein